MIWKLLHWYTDFPRWQKRLLTAITAMSILFLSALPGSIAPKWNWESIFQLDKVAHFLMYFSLSVLIYLSLDITIDQHRSKALLSFASASLYGVILEYLQRYYFENRSFDIIDIIFNISGALVGVIICILFDKKLIKQRHVQ